MPSGELYIISAPSGAGKTTLAKRLVEAVPELVLSVSHTTRARRPGEVDGVDYYFVDPATFEHMIEAGEFLEYAVVFGNWYGTSKQVIEDWLRQGKDVLLDIDWQGARKVRRQRPGAKSIFVLPPSRAELERRLRARGQDSEEVIAERMRQATAEMSHHSEYDHLVKNDDLDRAVNDLKAIIAGREPARGVAQHDLSELLASRGANR